MNKGEQLVLPSGEDPAEVRAAIDKERLDREDAERGTNRRLDLLQQRTERTSARPRGIVGYA